MPDLEMDYQTSVARSYELRRRPEWNAPSVQSIGESKLIRPTRNTMNYAVELLLQTPLPKLRPNGASANGREYPETHQVAVLEQNVLAIARRIGLLESHLNPDEPWASERESLWLWFFLAQDIQSAFTGHHPSGGPNGFEYPAAQLSVYLSFKTGRPRSMSVRPASTADALRYHAAQMAVSGTKAEACKSCSAPFLIGGPRARGKKKSGTRFCSEQCRWDYNNARRKKG
jgi:hypothetical protein